MTTVSAADKIGCCPLMMLLFASRSRIATVAVDVPSAKTRAGLIEREEVAVLAGPAMNEIRALFETAPAVTVTVFGSATVEVRVVAKTPVESVLPRATPTKLAVPEIVTVTSVPETGRPRAS